MTPLRRLTTLFGLLGLLGLGGALCVTVGARALAATQPAAIDDAQHEGPRVALVSHAIRTQHAPSAPRLLVLAPPASPILLDAPRTRGLRVERNGNSRALRVACGCTREPRAPPAAV